MLIHVHVIYAGLLILRVIHIGLVLHPWSGMSYLSPASPQDNIRQTSDQLVGQYEKILPNECIVYDTTNVHIDIR